MILHRRQAGIVSGVVNQLRMQTGGSALAPTRLGRVFAELRSRGGKAFIPYVMLGDPDLESSLAMGRALLAAGADALELGIPFSDPIADGPVIAAAGQRALEGGFRLSDAFTALRELRVGTDCPLCLMTYVNPILRRGLRAFSAEVAAAGGDALIVPDLPLEEGGVLAAACADSGLDLVRLLAPTSTDARIHAVVADASGFIYVVSVAGVTGARQDTLARVPETVARVRRLTTLPLCVGFGIDSPEKAAGAAAVADGVIVASALVGAAAGLGPEATPEARAAMVGDLASKLRAAVPR